VSKEDRRNRHRKRRSADLTENHGRQSQASQHPQHEPREHKMEENWRITAWELFATIISSVLGFYLLWPVSHQFFWISATIAVAVSLALIFPWRYGLPLGLVSLILGVVVLPHLPPNETQFHGWLTPADDPTPPSPCGPIPPETLGVFLGSSETIGAARVASIAVRPAGRAGAPAVGTAAEGGRLPVFISW
jgi:hypothetical protein